MSADTPKPLHVRVAEALGCLPTPVGSRKWQCECNDGAHLPGAETDDGLAHYDTDWSATGPLIEKYGLGVDPEPQSTDPNMKWYASLWPDGFAENAAQEYGPTPLIAVCNLILALKEAGKL